MPNQTRNGRDFDQTTVQAVWNKALIVSGVDPRFRRKDRCGAWIDRMNYGVTTRHGTGWEVDHT